MAVLFGIDFKELFGDIFGGDQLLDITIEPVTWSSDSQGGQSEAYASSISAKGVFGEWSDFNRLSGIPATDRLVIVIASTASTAPKKGDRITIEDNTYTVIAVQRDPGEATYECQLRG